METEKQSLLSREYFVAPPNSAMSSSQLMKH